MTKHEQFIEEQARAYLDYSQKENALAFNRWCESKDLNGLDRKLILQKVYELMPSMDTVN